MDLDKLLKAYRAVPDPKGVLLTTEQFNAYADELVGITFGLSPACPEVVVEWRFKTTPIIVVPKCQEQFIKNMKGYVALEG